MPFFPKVTMVPEFFQCKRSDIRSNIEVLVHWRNMVPSVDTWEPVDSLPGKLDLETLQSLPSVQSENDQRYADLRGSGVFEVEKFLLSWEHGKSNAEYVLVKWKNFPISASSWEPVCRVVRNLDEAEELDDARKRSEVFFFSEKVNGSVKALDTKVREQRQNLRKSYQSKNILHCKRKKSGSGPISQQLLLNDSGKTPAVENGEIRARNEKRVRTGLSFQVTRVMSNRSSSASNSSESLSSNESDCATVSPKAFKKGLPDFALEKNDEEFSQNYSKKSNCFPVVSVEKEKHSKLSVGKNDKSTTMELLFSSRSSSNEHSRKTFIMDTVFGPHFPYEDSLVRLIVLHLLQSLQSQEKNENEKVKFLCETMESQLNFLAKELRKTIDTTSREAWRENYISKPVTNEPYSKISPPEREIDSLICNINSANSNNVIKKTASDKKEALFNQKAYISSFARVANKQPSAGLHQESQNYSSLQSFFGNLPEVSYIRKEDKFSIKPCFYALPNKNVQDAKSSLQQKQGNLVSHELFLGGQKYYDTKKRVHEREEMNRRPVKKFSPHYREQRDHVPGLNKCQKNVNDIIGSEKEEAIATGPGGMKPWKKFDPPHYFSPPDYNIFREFSLSKTVNQYYDSGVGSHDVRGVPSPPKKMPLTAQSYVKTGGLPGFFPQKPLFSSNICSKETKCARVTSSDSCVNEAQYQQNATNSVTLPNNFQHMRNVNSKVLSSSTDFVNADITLSSKEVPEGFISLMRSNPISVSNRDADTNTMPKKSKAFPVFQKSVLPVPPVPIGSRYLACKTERTFQNLRVNNPFSHQNAENDYSYKRIITKSACSSLNWSLYPGNVNAGYFHKHPYRTPNFCPRPRNVSKESKAIGSNYFAFCNTLRPPYARNITKFDRNLAEYNPSQKHGSDNVISSMVQEENMYSPETVCIRNRCGQPIYCPRSKKTFSMYKGDASFQRSSDLISCGKTCGKNDVGTKKHVFSFAKMPTYRPFSTFSAPIIIPRPPGTEAIPGPPSPLPESLKIDAFGNSLRSLSICKEPAFQDAKQNIGEGSGTSGCPESKETVISFKNLISHPVCGNEGTSSELLSTQQDNKKQEEKLRSFLMELITQKDSALVLSENFISTMLSENITYDDELFKLSKSLGIEETLLCSLIKRQSRIIFSGISSSFKRYPSMHRCVCDKVKGLTDKEWADISDTIQHTVKKPEFIRSIRCVVCLTYEHTRCALFWLKRSVNDFKLLEILKGYICLSCRICTEDPLAFVETILDLKGVQLSSTSSKWYEESRQTSVISFNLLESQYNDLNDETVFVQIRGFEMNLESWRVSGFPHQMNLKISNSALDGKLFFTLKPPSLHRKRKDQPKLIPKKVLRHGRNIISVENFFKTPGQYFLFAIVIARRWTPRGILRAVELGSWLPENSSYMLCKSILSESLKAVVVDDEGEVEHDVVLYKKEMSVVSLRCPSTLTRITLPGRSVNCTHVQCFDVTYFILSQINVDFLKKRWRCPICSKYCLPHEIILDSFFRKILQETKETDKAVYLSCKDDQLSWSLKEKGEVGYSELCAEFSKNDDSNKLEVNQMNSENYLQILAKSSPAFPGTRQQTYTSVVEVD